MTTFLIGNRLSGRFAFSLIIGLLIQATESLAQLPAGFHNNLVQSGYATPMGTVFSADAKQLFVWDKAGRVWVSTWNGTKYVKQTTALLDISPEVGNWRDFGLLSLCLDPNFATNGLIYLLYVVDRHHLLHFGTSSYSDTKDEYFNATISRISRYKVNTTNDGLLADLTSRKVLLGESQSTGIPLTHESHAVGTLLFGHDGTLLVSTGDNASYISADLGSSSETYWQTAINDGILRANENVGAFRAQMPTSLCGKILRLDPNTGDGVPGNPFYIPANSRSAASRVWTLGLRNPYRMSLQPGTGSTKAVDGNPGVLLVGDVGWNNWEEMHIIRQGGENAGWPIYEGILENSVYALAAQTIENKDEPNPSNTCANPFLTFADLLKQASEETATVVNPCSGLPLPSLQRRYRHSVPALDWNHAASIARVPKLTAFSTTTVLIGATDSPVTGKPFNGNCSTGGTYYSGTVYPATYRNRYYFADYGANWIKAASLGTVGDITSVKEFVPTGGTNGIVDIEFNPLDGALYFTNINSGEIRKITYATNRPPSAVISVDKLTGTSPLTIQFKGDDSTDPDDDALVYTWNFGDGSASTLANPSHTFSSTGTQSFTAHLTVTDPEGLSSEQQLIIALKNAAPTAKITSPITNSSFPSNKASNYPLKAAITDESVSTLTYTWQVMLRRNNQQQVVSTITEASPTISLTPVGCDTEAFYLIKLTVTDKEGLSASDSVNLYPDCGWFTLAVQNFKATMSGPSSASLTWTAPIAPFDEVLIAVRTGNGFSVRPSGIDYTANPDLLGNSSVLEGGKIVYRGMTTSAIITNLSPQTTYYFRAFTRKDTTWSRGVEVSITTGVASSTLSQFDPTLCYKLTNRISGNALAVESGAITDGAPVRQRLFADQAWQKWKFQSLGSNTYQLIALHSNQALSVENASTQDWAGIVQNIRTTAANQKWIIQTGNDGYSTLKAVHSNKLLDIANQNDGGMVIQYAASGSYVQYWKIEATGCSNMASPASTTLCYKVTNRVSGKVLAVENGATASGAVVRQQTYANQLWQKWELRPGDDPNAYQLAAVHNGQVLTVKGGSLQDRATIVQDTTSNANHQKWIIQTNSDGYSTLKAVHSNKLLDIVNQDEDGMVIQYTFSGSYVQYWKLESVGCATNSGRIGADFDNTLTLFPNPAKEYLDIDVSIAEPTVLRMEVYNTVGQKVHTDNVSLEKSTIHRMSLPNLPNGIYVIQVKAGFKWQLTRRFIISQ
ncbi:RICIN domain-containing protein [Spirosoma aerolatum]|uniref:RICIN domain-containing protein n=1 Tax=Spirosoma aerolatum TaxID=1211326 RepID=UPI0009ABC318|nr:RICIN domain-containing protein [Spirosoma aerolatum]